MFFSSSFMEPSSLDIDSFREWRIRRVEAFIARTFSRTPLTPPSVPCASSVLQNKRVHEWMTKLCLIPLIGCPFLDWLFMWWVTETDQWILTLFKKLNFLHQPLHCISMYNFRHMHTFFSLKGPWSCSWRDSINCILPPLQAFYLQADQETSHSHDESQGLTVHTGNRFHVCQVLPATGGFLGLVLSLFWRWRGV